MGESLVGAQLVDSIENRGATYICAHAEETQRWRVEELLASGFSPLREVAPLPAERVRAVSRGDCRAPPPRIALPTAAPHPTTPALHVQTPTPLAETPAPQLQSSTPQAQTPCLHMTTERMHMKLGRARSISYGKPKNPYRIQPNSFGCRTNSPRWRLRRSHSLARRSRLHGETGRFHMHSSRFHMHSRRWQANSYGSCLSLYRNPKPGGPDPWGIEGGEPIWESRARD
jgi:hypothetical protein